MDLVDAFASPRPLNMNDVGLSVSHDQSPGGHDSFSNSDENDIGDFSRSSVGAKKRVRAPPNVTRSAAAYPRKRATQACQACRSRRTKCDNQRPACGFCQSTGNRCVYAVAVHSSFDAASLTILGKLEEIKSALSTLASAGSPTLNRDGLFAHQAWASCTVSDCPARALPEPDVDTPFSARAMKHASLSQPESITQWAVFGARAESLYKVSLPRLLNRVHKQHFDPLQCGAFPDPGNLDLQTLNTLAARYMENSNVKAPILNSTILAGHIRHFAEHGPRWDATSCLVLLVCAIGAISDPFDRHRPILSLFSPEAASGRSFFLSAQKRIGLIAGQTSLIATQCMFLAGVYFMATMDILAGWKMFVQTVTHSLAYFHSKSSQDDSILPSSYETVVDCTLVTLEESVYWAGLKSELEIRLQLNLPVSGTIDQGYLSILPTPPITTESISPSSASVVGPSTSPGLFGDNNSLQETSWLFFLSEIALRKVFFRVLQSPIDGASECSSKGACPHMTEYPTLTLEEVSQITSEFIKQVETWEKSLPAVIRFSRDTDTRSLLRFILRGHSIDIRDHILCTPFVREYINSDVPRTLILDRMTSEWLENCVQRIRVNEEGFAHRHHGTWFLIRSCLQAAISLLAAKKAHRLDDLLPANWWWAVSRVLDLLQMWEDESDDIKVYREILQDMTAEAIEGGEHH